MAPSKNDSIKKKLADLISKKQYKDALNICENELLVGHSSSIIHAYKGFCLMNLDRIQDSITSLNRSLEMDENQEIAQRSLIDIYTKQNDFEKVESIYQSLIHTATINKSEKRFIYYPKLAKLYEENHQYSDAYKLWSLLLDKPGLEPRKIFDIYSYMVKCQLEFTFSSVTSQSLLHSFALFMESNPSLSINSTMKQSLGNYVKKSIQLSINYITKNLSDNAILDTINDFISIYKPYVSILDDQPDVPSFLLDLSIFHTEDLSICEYVKALSLCSTHTIEFYLFSDQAHDNEYYEPIKALSSNYMNLTKTQNICLSLLVYNYHIIHSKEGQQLYYSQFISFFKQKSVLIPFLTHSLKILIQRNIQQNQISLLPLLYNDLFEYLPSEEIAYYNSENIYTLLLLEDYNGVMSSMQTYYAADSCEFNYYHTVLYLCKNDKTSATSLISSVETYPESAYCMKQLILLWSQDQLALASLIPLLQHLKQEYQEKQHDMFYLFTFMWIMMFIAKYYQQTKNIDKAIKCLNTCYSFASGNKEYCDLLLDLNCNSGISSQLISLCNILYKQFPFDIRINTYLAEYYIANSDYIHCYTLLSSLLLKSELFSPQIYAYFGYASLQLGKIETSKLNLIRYIQTSLLPSFSDSAIEIEHIQLFDKDYPLEKQGETDIYMILAEIYALQSKYTESNLLYSYIFKYIKSAPHPYIYSNAEILTVYSIVKNTLKQAMEIYAQGRVNVAASYLSTIDSYITVLQHNLTHSKAVLKLLTYVYIWKLLTTHDKKYISTIRRYTYKYIYMYPNDSDSWYHYALSAVYITYNNENNTYNDANTPFYVKSEYDENSYNALLFLHMSIYLSSTVSLQQLYLLAILDPRQIVKHHILSYILQKDPQEEYAYIELSKLYLNTHCISSAVSLIDHGIESCEETGYLKTYKAFTNLLNHSSTNIINPSSVFFNEKYPQAILLYSTNYYLYKDSIQAQFYIEKYVSTCPSLYALTILTYVYLLNHKYSQCYDLCLTTLNDPKYIPAIIKTNTVLEQVKYTLIFFAYLSSCLLNAQTPDVSLAVSLASQKSLFMYSEPIYTDVTLMMRTHLAYKHAKYDIVKNIFEEYQNSHSVSEMNNTTYNALYQYLLLSFPSVIPPYVSSLVNHKTQLLSACAESNVDKQLEFDISPFISDLDLYKYVSIYQTYDHIQSLLNKLLFLNPLNLKLSYYYYIYKIYSLTYMNESVISDNQSQDDRILNIKHYLAHLLYTYQNIFTDYNYEYIKTSLFLTHYSSVYYYKSLSYLIDVSENDQHASTRYACKALFLQPQQSNYWVQLSTCVYHEYIMGSGTMSLENIQNFVKSIIQIDLQSRSSQTSIYISLLYAMVVLPTSSNTIISILNNLKTQYSNDLNAFNQQLLYITSLMLLKLNHFDKAVECIMTSITNEQKQKNKYNDNLIILYYYLAHIYFVNKMYTNAKKVIKAVEVLLESNTCIYKQQYLIICKVLSEKYSFYDSSSE